MFHGLRHASSFSLYFLISTNFYDSMISRYCSIILHDLQFGLRVCPSKPPAPGPPPHDSILPMHPPPHPHPPKKHTPSPPPPNKQEAQNKSQTLQLFRVHSWRTQLLLIAGLSGYSTPKCPRNSLGPHYLVPHCYLGHIPSLFGSEWVVGYQVVEVLRVPRKWWMHFPEPQWTGFPPMVRAQTSNPDGSSQNPGTSI